MRVPGMWRLEQLGIKIMDAISPSILNYKHPNGRHDLTKVYDAQSNFAARIVHKNAYYAFSEALGKVLKPRKGVVDIGCANGFNLEYFKSKGLHILGIEGSAASYEYLDTRVGDQVFQLDLRDDLINQFSTKERSQNDLVICTEVAEHIESQFEQIFLTNVLMFVNKYLVISWSPSWDDPHRGTELQAHWNPRNKAYVRRVLEGRGLVYCEKQTQQIVDKLNRCPEVADTEYKHWAENLFVFKKEL